MQDTSTETSKEVMKIPERMIRPLSAPLEDWNIFPNSPNRKQILFQKLWVCGRYQCQKNFILHSMKSLRAKYRQQLWRKESTVTTVVHFVCRNVTWTVGCAVTCLAAVDVTDTSGQWSESRRVVLLAMTDRRGTEDKHVTVRDTVRFGARSNIATDTVIGRDCTGANRWKYMFRVETLKPVRLILRKQTGLSWGLLSKGRFSVTNLISNS